MRLPRACKKNWYSLRGGPFHGSYVLLTEPSTMVIRAGGYYGRYVGAQWEDMS